MLHVVTSPLFVRTAKKSTGKKWKHAKYMQPNEKQVTDKI